VDRVEDDCVSGYTPVFDTVFDGTLCGRWPTLPVWLTILPMADKNGHIDMTYQAIAARSGWPLELLKQAIAELMAPDPESRTAECEGRRLELLDPANRQWGWRVINHVQYRNKARKAAYDTDRTASGADAERKRHSVRHPDKSRRVPTRPDVTRPQTQTQTQTQTQIQALRARVFHGERNRNRIFTLASLASRTFTQRLRARTGSLARRMLAT